MFLQLLLLFLFQQDEFGNDGVDLYDDVIGAPSSGGEGEAPASQQLNTSSSSSGTPAQTNERSPNNGGPPYHHGSNNVQANHGGRRYQLYVGNLTWVCRFLFISCRDELHVIETGYLVC